MFAKIAVLLLPAVLLPLVSVDGFAFVGSAALPRRHGAKQTRATSTSMKLELGGGSYVALVTPMTPEGAVDEPTLRALLQWHAASGTDGVVVLGTTGEASTLNEAERGLVLRATVEELRGKMPIIAGTGGISPAKVIAHTHAAAEAGVDGCLVVTPYYVKPTQAGLVKFFTTVADQVPLPMVLYNVPGRTGVDMQLDAVAECSQHPGIVGMKEATGDNTRVKPMVEKCSKGFLLYSGDDAGACEFVLQGGHGVISVTADVAPALVAKMMAAAREGRREEALSINQQLSLLHDRLFLASNPIPAKWALERMGRLPSGALRLPLLELEEPHRSPLEEALTAGGCL